MKPPSLSSGYLFLLEVVINVQAPLVLVFDKFQFELDTLLFHMKNAVVFVVQYQLIVLY